MDTVSSDQSDQLALQKEKEPTEKVPRKEVLAATQEKRVEGIEEGTGGTQAIVKAILSSQPQEIQQTKKILAKKELSEQVENIVVKTEQAKVSAKVNAATTNKKPYLSIPIQQFPNTLLKLNPIAEQSSNESENNIKLIRKIVNDCFQNKNKNKNIESFNIAVKDGNEKLVDVFIDEFQQYTKNKNLYKNYLSDALLIAAEEGHKNIVNKLLLAGADKAKAGGRGTPLILAAAKGHQEVVDLLINFASRDINSQLGFILKICKNQSALMAAANEGHKDIVKMLLENIFTLIGDEGDKKEKYINEILLFIAQEGDANSVKTILPEILELIKDKKEKEKCMSDFLWLVAGTGNKEAICTFIEFVRIKGLDLSTFINHCKDEKDQVTALMYALLCSHDEVAQILIENGANVKACTSNGYTVLIYAMLGAKQNGYETNIIKTILEMLGTEQREFEKRYAERFIDMVFLAHVCGLKGYVNIQRIEKEYSINLEGSYRNYIMRMLSQYLNEFFKLENEIPPEVKKEIQESFENAFPLKDSATIISRINEHKPVVILGGSTDHAVSIVVHDKVFICNRGEGSEEMGTTTMAFDLPAPEKTETMIKNFTRMYADIQTFNQTMLDLTCNAKEGFSQKLQKVGNCTYASAKGALRILLGKEGYKKFTSWIRAKVVDDYCIRYLEEEDDEILDKLHEKGLSILKEELKKYGEEEVDGEDFVKGHM